MSLIFGFSTTAGSTANTSRIIEPLLRWLLPQLSESAIHQAHHYIRKAGHLTEYAVLGWLLWRALWQSSRDASRASIWKPALTALALSAAYAATDEWHQTFVSTRTPSVRDVMIDTTGALFGIVLAGTMTTVRRPLTADRSDPSNTGRTRARRRGLR
jgi:VanZ family protein